jgi:hypothetical protein
MMLVGVAACLLPAPGFAQEDTGEAARNWARIAQCGSIAEAERRLGCMDGVLREAGIASAAISEAAPRQQARLNDSAPPTPGAPAPRSREPEREDTGPVATTIASVQTIGYQRVLVTTAEGSVWEQTQAETFRTPAKAGDAFSVEPAAMGSFRCRFNQSTRYRCKQVN